MCGRRRPSSSIFRGLPRSWCSTMPSTLPLRKRAKTTDTHGRQQTLAQFFTFLILDWWEGHIETRTCFCFPHSLCDVTDPEHAEGFSQIARFLTGTHCSSRISVAAGVTDSLRVPGHVPMADSHASSSCAATPTPTDPLQDLQEARGFGRFVVQRGFSCSLPILAETS